MPIYSFSLTLLKEFDLVRGGQQHCSSKVYQLSPSLLLTKPISELKEGGLGGGGRGDCEQ